MKQVWTVPLIAEAIGKSPDQARRMLRRLGIEPMAVAGKSLVGLYPGDAVDRLRAEAAKPNLRLAGVRP